MEFFKSNLNSKSYNDAFFSRSVDLRLPEIRRSSTRSELTISGRIIVAFVDAGTLLDGHAVSGGIQRLAFRAVAAFDALAPAFRVGGNVVARPRARIAAHLVRLTSAAVDTCRHSIV